MKRETYEKALALVNKIRTAYSPSWLKIQPLEKLPPGKESNGLLFCPLSIGLSPIHWESVYVSCNGQVNAIRMVTDWKGTHWQLRTLLRLGKVERKIFRKFLREYLGDDHDDDDGPDDGSSPTPPDPTGMVKDYISEQTKEKVHVLC